MQYVIKITESLVVDRMKLLKNNPLMERGEINGYLIQMKKSYFLSFYQHR